MSRTGLPVDLDRCTQLLGHGPVTLVTSAHGGKANVMAAAWSMPLDCRFFATGESFVLPSIR